jgi:hypothetical protein
MLIAGSLAFAILGYPLFLLLNSGSLAAAIVSLLTILTIRETARRPLPQGVADEMFQSEADVHGAVTTGSRRSYS